MKTAGKMPGKVENSLHPAQNRTERYLAAIPTSARGIIARSLSKQGSPRSAIKAKCLDCCNFDRSEISDCSVVICPLHPWRPFQAEILKTS